MKALIFGSRGVKPTDGLLARLLSNIQVSAIIEGGGIEKYIRRHARIHNIRVFSVDLERDKYGVEAESIRDDILVNESDMGVAIWDGSSQGTLNLINKMKRSGKRMIIYEIR